MPIRMGEALNPGPFAISAINPTGLAGKGAEFDSLPMGIYAVSESHLTPQGLTRFRQELKGCKSKFQFFSGEPAPYRSQSIRSCGGKQTGVGFLSSCPCRPITLGWNKELYSTSRLAAASFWTGTCWITGGVAYGYASQAHTQEVQNDTNELLKQLTLQVVEGPQSLAFVSGDFNQLPGILQEVKEWENKGWKDIQCFAEEQWGVVPTPTCKQTTRKDFLYLSPQLQQYITAASNRYDRFPDHSILTAYVDIQASLPREAYWYKPEKIAFLEQEIKQIQNQKVTPPNSENPDKQYQQIFQEYEAVVHAHKIANGKPGLLPNQRGRATSTNRKFRPAQTTPLKPSRPSEVEPTYQGRSIQHKRWFTQLRRLQAYVAYTKKNLMESMETDHSWRVWRAIRFASGFQPSFAEWWNHRAIRNPDAPTSIPTAPPKYQTALAIFNAFEAEVRQLELVLAGKRKEFLASQQHKSLTQAFRDVKKAGPLPVQVLLSKNTATVQTIIDDKTFQIEVARQWDTMHPVTSTNGTFKLSQVDGTTLTTNTSHQLAQGDIISQEKLHGSVEDIHQQFAAEWTKRWDKHLELDETYWEEILGFIDLALPSHTMQYQPIDLQTWKASFLKKSHRSATGLDGVSRQDLIALPDELHLEIIKLLHQAEEQGRWPEQLLHGAIHALAKVPSAETVQQFRPITILPIIYRCWATIRSRQSLQFLSEVAPPSMLGNMPGRTTAEIWWTLQADLETAMSQGRRQSGLVTDLIKAFNGLPRTPIFAAAIKLGIDGRIVRGWASAVAKVKRHFWVRNQPGPALGSSTGLPEGCGMSVVGMAIYNIIMHRYIELRHPTANLTTYVDNIEIMAEEPEQVLSAYDTFEALTGHLGVPVDEKKTYTWSCDATGRQTLRQRNQVVLQQARDLGGHISYTGQQTNSTVTQKCKDLQELWPKLAQSTAGVGKKQQLLLLVAWPRALHSASVVHLSEATLTDIRRGAMKGLGLDKAGANPLLQLSLGEKTPMSDPGFFILWDSVTKLRRLATHATASMMIAVVTWTPDRQKRPGPHGVLTSRLSKIGWQHFVETIFLDQEGYPIDIWHAPIQELKLRLQRAWNQHVGSRIQHRHGFAGMHKVDAFSSQTKNPKWTHEEVGLIRVLHNGTMITNDHLHAIGKSNDNLCRFCKQTDSLEHRHWHCEATQPFRDHLTKEHLEYASTLPECARERAWFPEPNEIVEYKNSLYLIPDTTRQWEPIVVEAKCVDVFTDGTAIDPAIPEARLVAWSAVVSTSQETTPLAMGGVPGQWQSVLRAEITAVISALEWTKHINKDIRIWCDNDTVVKEFRKFQQKQTWTKPTGCDHDLWNRMKHAIATHPGKCIIIKVDSHQDETIADTFQQWVFAGNNAADTIAKIAISCLPQVVVAKQKKAAAKARQTRAYNGILLDMYAKIGMFAVTNKAPEQSRAEDIVPQLIDHSKVICFKDIANTALNAPDRLKVVGFHKIIGWMLSLDDPNPNAKVYAVTWLELLWSFQAATNIRSFISAGCHGQWTIRDTKQEYDILKESHAFANYIIALTRLEYPTFKPINAKPSNYRYQHWAMCIYFRWNENNRNSVMTWLQSKIGSRQIKKVHSDVIDIPPAFDEEGPMVHTPSVGLHRFFK